METKPCLTEAIILTAVRLKSVGNRFVFTPMNLTSSRFRILRMLSKRGLLTPGEILKFSGGTKSNITQRLNFLEHQGFIRRTYSQKKGDRRNVFIKLTPKGITLVKKVMKHFQKSITALESCFTKQELSRFFSFTAKLNQLLDDNKDKIPQLFDLKP